MTPSRRRWLVILLAVALCASWALVAAWHAGEAEGEFTPVQEEIR